MSLESELDSVDTSQSKEQIESQVRDILARDSSVSAFWTVEIDLGCTPRQFDNFEELYNHHFGDIETDDPVEYLRDAFSVSGAILHETYARQWTIYPTKKMLADCLERFSQNLE